MTEHGTGPQMARRLGTADAVVIGLGSMIGETGPETRRRPRPYPSWFDVLRSLPGAQTRTKGAVSVRRSRVA